MYNKDMESNVGYDGAWYTFTVGLRQWPIMIYQSTYRNTLMIYYSYVYIYIYIVYSFAPF
jgi:hypothetical protein